MPRLGTPVEEMRKLYAKQIDDEAEETRALFITLNAGQGLVYEQKLREADLIMANTTHVNGEYVTDVQTPEVSNLAVEADDLGGTLYEAAQTVLTQAYQWAQASAVIESIRLRAKRQLKNATNPKDMREVFPVDWSPATSYL